MTTHRKTPDTSKPQPVAAYGELEVYEWSTGFELVLLSTSEPAGEDQRAWIGDGVDFLFDKNDRALMPGTKAFYRALERWLKEFESEPEALEAYFPGSHYLDDGEDDQEVTQPDPDEAAVQQQEQQEADLDYDLLSPEDQALLDEDGKDDDEAEAARAAAETVEQAADLNTRLLSDFLTHEDTLDEPGPGEPLQRSPQAVWFDLLPLGQPFVFGDVFSLIDPARFKDPYIKLGETTYRRASDPSSLPHVILDPETFALPLRFDYGHPVTFASLEVGRVFEFDHDHLPSHLISSLERGPWTKISPRMYEKAASFDHTRYHIGSASIACWALKLTNLDYAKDMTDDTPKG